MKDQSKKKKAYIKPSLEVIKIRKDEIISTSGVSGNSFGSSYLSGNGYNL